MSCCIWQDKSSPEELRIRRAGKHSAEARDRSTVLVLLAATCSGTPATRLGAHSYDFPNYYLAADSHARRILPAPHGGSGCTRKGPSQHRSASNGLVPITPFSTGHVAFGWFASAGSKTRMAALQSCSLFPIAWLMSGVSAYPCCKFRVSPRTPSLARNLLYGQYYIVLLRHSDRCVLAIQRQRTHGRISDCPGP